jgi:hypothetical protein
MKKGLVMGEWRSIPDLGGYLAANDGRIKSPRGRVLSLRDNGNGYLYFSVQRRFGLNRRRALHVAVCSAWHGPKPDPSHEARHLDGNKRNNSPGNLAWGTVAENKKDMLRPGLAPPRGKLSREDVEEIRVIIAKGPQTVREKSIGHCNYAAIARIFKVTRRHIKYIADGDAWEFPE